MYRITRRRLIQQSWVENEVARVRSKWKRTQVEYVEDFMDFGASSIRCLNFHLITALIKANRSERKAPVSLFRVNRSYQMIKGHSGK